MFDRIPDSSRPDSVILNLIKIILYNNDFTFNDIIFIQKKGVAMGQRFYPQLQIFTYRFGKKTLKIK